jgi:hypothetical protein
MLRRLISFALLICVEFCFGGPGQYLHERIFHADEMRGTLAGAHRADKPQSQDSPTHDPEHDHDRCPTCQLLAAARIHHLPAPMIFIASADVPTHIRPVPQSAPRRIFTETSIEARGPPRAILA